MSLRSLTTKDSNKRSPSLPQQHQSTTSSVLFNVSDEEVESLEQIAKRFKDAAEVKDRTYKLKTYHNCFVGRDAVTILKDQQSLATRQEAVELGRKLAFAFNLFVHVTGDHTLCDDYLFYTFQDNLDCELQQNLTMYQMRKQFEQGVICQDRTHHLRVYPSCFVGREAVDFLVNAKICKSRQHAVDLGRLFVQHNNLFEHVHRDHQFEDSYLFYRFVPRRLRTICFCDACRGMLDDGTTSSSSSSSSAASVSIAAAAGAAGVDHSESASHFYPQSPRNTTLATTMWQSSSRSNFQSLTEIAETLERGLDVRDRRYRLTTYQNVFVGRDAVTFMVDTGIARSRKEAVATGLELQDELNLFRHVTATNKTGGGSSRHFDLSESSNNSEHEEHSFEDGYYFFRFTPAWERTEQSIAPQRELPLETIAERFEKYVTVKDHTYRLKTYKQTFVASKAVDWLVRSKIAESRRDAVQIGRKLQQDVDLFEHVTGDHLFSDDELYFRFRPLDERRSLSDSHHQDSFSDTSDVPAKLKEVATAFLNGIKVKNNRYRTKTFKNTFVGSEAVDFLVNSSLAESRKEAVQLGRQLEQPPFSLFHHVTNDHSFADDWLFFSFSTSRSVPGLSSASSVSTVTLDRIAEEFIQGVKVADRRYRLKVYKNVFVGSEAVDFMVGSGLTETRQDAVYAGRKLARDLDLFEHVTKEHQFSDEHLFFRFIQGGKASPLEDDIPSVQLVNIARKLEREGLEIQDRLYRFRRYKQCCIGNQAITYLVESGLADSRSHAVLLARAVNRQFCLLEHVTNAHKLEDAHLFYSLAPPRQRVAQGKWFTVGNRRAAFWPLWEESDEQDDATKFWRVVSDVLQGRKLNAFDPRQQVFQVLTDDSEWAERVRKFEKNVALKHYANSGLTGFAMNGIELMNGSSSHGEERSKVKLWGTKLLHSDPRYQIHYYFNEVARTGAQTFDDNDNSPESAEQSALRPLLRYLPHNLASVFTVWRPTSFDAIRKMMLGEAVGKGLDIKGKSAKRGKLSGFVPFLQISENRHKHKIRMLSRSATIRVFFAKRQARDVAAEKCEQVADEMMQVVKQAKKILEGGKMAANMAKQVMNMGNAIAAKKQEDPRAHQDAVDCMLLDMEDPTIHILNDYAPNCYGMELPERLFWEAFIVRSDLSRRPGSQYDTGRPSVPAFQDLNFAATRAEPRPGEPKAVVYHNSSHDFNPMELLMAYEERGRVLPVVSDFDCFLVGTKRVKFQKSLQPEQAQVLQWLVNQIELLLKQSKSETAQSWTETWLQVLKQESSKGFHPDIPRFGFGDPKSYSIMEQAVKHLNISGAVRHGAECFNYYFPQDIDSEFLVIATGINGNTPWKYVKLDELQEILCQKVEEGYAIPLNPKWILCNAGPWNCLYQKMLQSSHPNVQAALDIWFPPQIRAQIARIQQAHPKGFYQDEYVPQMLHSSISDYRQLILI